MNHISKITIAIACMGLSAISYAQSSSTEVRQIDEVVVVGERSQVELTSEFAGGQVARGGRAGLLGNLDFLDSPFAGTAFTSDLVISQQSESVGDVLLNDPVVRVTKGFGNFQEVYVIRGFPVFSDDITLNGVYGILPRQFVAAELLERVEVFRGANAFLNGAAPGGSGVGGTINLVPKRAPDDGIKRITLGYEEGSQFFGTLDIGDRFGSEDKWGVRFNAVYRDGETSIDDQDRDLNAFSIGTDYSGDRFKFTADLGYQDNRIDVPRPQVTPLGEIPDEPDASINFGQNFTFTDEQQTFAVARGEYDITDTVRVWFAGGIRDGDEANVLANPNAAADGSLTVFRFDNTREDDIVSFDAGIEASFTTGSIEHTLVVSASDIKTESKNAFAFSNFFEPLVTDLYNPINLPAPDPDFFIGGDLSNPLLTERVDNKSVAIADTLAFLDQRLLVTVGLRMQDIETTSFDFTTGERTSGYEADETTPALGVVWKVSDSWSIYGNYAESLQPGEIAPAQSGSLPILNAGETLDPFIGEQIELGVKYDGGNFGGTLSAFSLDRANAIVVDQLFVASGSQENQGLELSVFGEPLDGFRIIGGVTIVDAELSRTQDGLDQGNSPIGVPDLQANINLEWDVKSIPGLTFDGRVVHTDNQFTNTANTIEIDSWQRVDLGARYATEVADNPVTFRLRLDNVFDESYWASTGGFPGANYLILGNPRTLSVSASLNF